MALLHRAHDRDHDPDVADVPDHPPAEWTARSDPDRVVVRRNSAGQTVRTVVATICIVAIAAFLLLNTDETEVDLGFDTFTSPLWVTTGVAAAVGVVLGFALGHRGRADRG